MAVEAQRDGVALVIGTALRLWNDMRQLNIGAALLPAKATETVASNEQPGLGRRTEWHLN